MKKESPSIIGLSLLLILPFLTVRAQYIRYDDVFRTPKVGVIIGAHGIGIEGGIPIAPHLFTRVGLNYFPLSSLNIGYNNNPVELNRSNVNAFLDWKPFANQSGFIAEKGHVSTGFSYYFENSLIRDYREDNESYTIRFARATPYIGIGLQDIHLNKAILLGLDFGYFIPLKRTEVTLQGGPNEYRYNLLDEKWNSFRYRLLSGMNASLGIYYRL